MKYFKAQLKLASPLGTPLAADTLFGHLCWGIRYSEGGKEELQNFLEAMAGDSPALLLSNPFPQGKLPVPIIPFLLENNKKSSKDSDDFKDVKKRKWIEFNRLKSAYSPLSSQSLLTALREEIKQEVNSKAMEYNAVSTGKIDLIPHNVVSRFGCGTFDGGVFLAEDRMVDSVKGEFYDLYLASPVYNEEKIKQLLTQALQCGYGRDKSTGRGVIYVESIESFIMPKVSNPNAVMLLGSCAPAKDDPTDGFWQIHPKSGRLGGHWAITQENPFKKTILMFQCGSILKTNEPKHFYGRMVKNAHPSVKEVQHYGLALAMPIRLKNNDI